MEEAEGEAGVEWTRAGRCEDEEEASALMRVVNEAGLRAGAEVVMEGEERRSERCMWRWVEMRVFRWVCAGKKKERVSGMRAGGKREEATTTNLDGGPQELPRPWPGALETVIRRYPRDPVPQLFRRGERASLECRSGREGLLILKRLAESWCMRSCEEKRESA